MDRELDVKVRRARTIRRVGTGFAAVAAGACVLFLVPHWLRPSVDRNDVRFARVERGDLEATVRASGNVVPANERVLSSPVEARVVRVLRQPGGLLRPGDAILELDTSATRLEVEKLEERLAQNENDRAQRRLELGKTVAGLEHQIESQRLDLEVARYRLERDRKLHADGLTSEEALKESEVAVKKAAIQLQRFEDEIAAERESHRTQLERLELDARILRRELEDTRRQLDLATTRVGEPGVLTWVIEETGTALRRGDVLARIADLESFRVEATVSDAYAPRLEVGQAVHVLAGDESLPARLAMILPTIEDGALKFTADLEDPSHPGLRHNLRVDVLVVTGFRADVLKVPRGPYIRGGGDLHQVFVVRGDRAVRTDVRLGLVGHEYYELVDGLAEGDEIIVSDMSRRLHAEQIRVR
jgi:HlyD family secretion protein